MTEQQALDAVTAPEMAPVSESTESTSIKKQHGGFRPGAGRKKDVVKRLVGRLPATTAAQILANVDPEKVIKEIFAKGSLALRQRTLADLWDRAFGRPAQNVNLAGSVVHWTPDLYAHLTDEEIQVLARIAQKPTAALPEINGTTPNQGGNQPE